VTVLRRLLAGAVALVACGGFATAAHAATPLYVSLTFDDGLQGDSQFALPALNDFGYKATFYLNSGPITSGAPDRMSWADVAKLKNAGMELAGHTIDHKNLTTLWNATPEAQRHDVVKSEICDDRQAILDNVPGLTSANLTSFAYPNGAWTIGADQTTIPNIVQECGYTNARTTQGIAINLPEPYHCDVCYAPLIDRTARPFSLRASQARGSKIAAEGDDTTPPEEGNDDIIPLSTLQGRTQLALDAVEHPGPDDIPNSAPADGGWLVLVLHDVCADETTAPCGPSQDPADRGHSTTDATLRAYLKWLKDQSASHCIVVATVQTMMTSTPACPPVSDPGTGGGGSAGGGGTGGGGGGGGGSSSTTTTTTTTTPVDAPVETPAAPVETPPVTVNQAASTSTPGAPTVRLLTASSKLLGKGVVGFRAIVNAPAGTKRVEFLVDGKVVGTSTTGPYRFSWSPKAGKGKTTFRTVKISVRVTDSSGRVTKSATRSVKVRVVAKTKAHV
jgi:peptidoglycan/xylan/chitin deacetylase (PgdA/CDA1 family)